MTTPANTLAPLSSASFPVDAALVVAAGRAGVPGLMLCCRCGADHVDPAIASPSTMSSSGAGEGWVCGDGYGCGE